MQIEEFKNAFKVFDRRKVGMFTIDDVSWVMKMLGQKASPAELEAIIKARLQHMYLAADYTHKVPTSRGVTSSYCACRTSMWMEMGSST